MFAQTQGVQKSKQVQENTLQRPSLAITKFINTTRCAILHSVEGTQGDTRTLLIQAQQCRENK